MDLFNVIPSQHGPGKTMDRLEAAVRRRGMTIFTRIDHAAGAAQMGLSLRPTVLLIFGNPQAGTVLMQTNQAIGIDLPLRALVWEDERAKTWIASTDPARLAKLHGSANAGTANAIQAMTEALGALVHSAANTE